MSLEELKKTWMADLEEDCIFISAVKKDNIDQLRDVLYQRIKAIHITRYPYDQLLY